MQDTPSPHPPATQLVLDRMMDLQFELETRLEAVRQSYSLARTPSVNLRSAKQLLPWVLSTALVSALLTALVTVRW